MAKFICGTHSQRSFLLLFLKENLQGFPAGSKASRHVLEVPRRERRQHNLAVSCLEVRARPLRDVEHGADLLRDDNLAFRADDG